MSAKLHTVPDAEGATRFFMPAGQVRDHTGAAALAGDRGHDAGWFREMLEGEGIKPCIPGMKSRGKSVKHDKNATNDATESRSCPAA